MKRRALLTSLAASALPLAAGCVDGGGAEPTADGTDDTPRKSPTPTDERDDGDPTRSQTDANSPTETGTPASDLGFTIEETTLQRGLVVPKTPDSIAVQHTDRSYLWMTLSVEHSPPELSAFRIEVPPKSYVALGVDEHRAYRTTWADERYYDETTGTALLLIELPYRVEGDTAAFGGSATGAGQDASILDRLRHDPPPMNAALEKRYAETPDEPVAVRATNEGDVTGRFLGAINREGPAIAYAPVARVSVPLEPGETRTVPIADSVADGTPRTGSDGEPEMTYHIDWATGDDRMQFG